ncbi:MAG: hypothetical protein KKG92_03590 [Gammaproteobacteria bacterium]|nr:hypothetical protein [Gammaproteobacteria bacterium]
MNNLFQYVRRQCQLVARKIIPALRDRSLTSMLPILISARFGNISPSFFNWLIFSFAALSVHGLLILNDGVYWDGWLLNSILQDRRLDDLQDWYMTLGLPIGAYFNWLFSYAGNIVASYKIVAFLSLVGVAATTYHLAGRIMAASINERLLVALVVLTYPGYQNAVDMVTVLYLVCLLLFLLAWSVALHAKLYRGRCQLPFRVISLILFFLSFNFNSLLVVYLVAFVSILAASQRNTLPSTSKFDIVQRLIRAVWSNLDFLFLPFIYWIMKETLSPRAGLYSNYNRFNLDWVSVVDSFAAFVSNGLLYQFYDAFRFLVHSPWLLIVVMPLSFLLMQRSARGHGRLPHPSSPTPIVLFLWGVLILILSILPYALVGLSPTRSGWGTRHALLLGLSLSVLLLAMVRAFSKAGVVQRYLVALLLSGLIVGFAGVQFYTYLSWQARWAKDKSVIEALRSQPQYSGYSTYYVSDSFPLGRESWYRFYEWGSLMQAAWGGQSRVGLDASIYPENFFHQSNNRQFITRLYNIESFNPSGPKICLHISPSEPKRSPARLAVDYLYARYISAAALPVFLKTVSDIQFCASPPCPWDCPLSQAIN